MNNKEKSHLKIGDTYSQGYFKNLHTVDFWIVFCDLLWYNSKMIQ